MDEAKGAHSIRWELPSVTPQVVPGYTPIFSSALLCGNQVHLSGRLAKREGQLLVGRVDAEIPIDEARESARGVALELLAALREAAGGLDRVEALGRLFVMVRGAEHFTEPHVIANAASEVLLSVLGDRGKHARSAMGAAQLPFGVCIEAELSAFVRRS